jgi:DNA helicase-2/ATP-dependent DNA helicase PcrA
MTEYFFKKLKQIEKDPLQFKSYNSIGNTVVTAGPGSGKTTVLTLKVMRLLEESIIEPRGLACLTYSREAAREFQDRLKLLGFKKRKNVFLGTVHSFCLAEILSPFGEVFPQYQIPTPIKIISEKQKLKIFEKVITEIGYNDLTITDMDKERSRDITGFSKVVIESYDVALKVAVLFEKHLHESGYIDYISMVKFATKMIQNERYIQKNLEAKFPWLVIDEYQDLGKPLHEMVLSLLAKTKIKIFAVGDADQSIYDFQGASPEYLVELSQNGIIENYIHLTNNYRSAQEIVNASEAVLQVKRNYVAFGNNKDFNATFDFVVCECGMDEQYLKAIKIISELNKSGTPYHEIAVLLAYQNQIKQFANLCLKKGLPFYMTKQSFERSDFVKWLELCAAWVTNSDKISFEDVYEFWEFILSSHSNIILHEERIFFKRHLYNQLKESIKFKESLSDWLEQITTSLDIFNLLKTSELYPDEVENLEKLKYMMLQPPYNTFTLEQFTRLGSPQNQIVISSRHGSKGLEFDTVLMLGMEKDNFPRYNCTKRELEEAHRLCFVCVSRARKKCVLIRSEYHDISTRKGDIWHKNFAPSPFWNILFLRSHRK